MAHAMGYFLDAPPGLNSIGSIEERVLIQVQKDVGKDKGLEICATGTSEPYCIAVGQPRIFCRQTDWFTRLEIP
jgi:hypothetical protein